MKESAKGIPFFAPLILAIACLLGMCVALPQHAWAAEAGDADALQQALKSGDEVTLSADIEGTFSVPRGVEVTLDLAGHTLSSAGYTVEVEGTLVIVDSTASAVPTVNSGHTDAIYNAGSIVSSGAKSAAVIAKNGGNVVLKSGIVKSTGNIGLAAQGNTAGTSPVASSVTIDGGLVDAQEFAASPQYPGASVTVNGGVLVARDNAVVGGNGSLGLGGYEINVSGGVLISNIQTSGYTACGIYAPNTGVVNVSGGTIYSNNGAGIVARAGTVNVTGGDIVCTGSITGKVGDSQVAVTSSPIVVDTKSGYSGLPDGDVVNIQGGSFTSAPGVPSVNNILSDPSTEVRTVVVAGTFSDASVLPYIESGKVALSTDGESFSVMTEDEAVQNGGEYSVAVDGTKVFFVDKDAAENFAENNPTVGGDTPAVNPVYCIVTIDPMNSEAVTTQKVISGEKLVKPADPVKDGFVFNGWFADEALTQPYDFEAPVTADITIYAKWEKAQQQVDPGTPGGNTSVTDRPSGDKPAGDKPANGKTASGATFAKTGDPLNVAPILALCGCAALVALGAFALRIRDNR